MELKGLKEELEENKSDKLKNKIEKLEVKLKRKEQRLKAAKYGLLSPRYIQQMINRYSDRAELKKDISPHTLRHTFATGFYSQMKDIRKTQKALGHSDISTTMIYTHIVDDELENAMKNYNRRRK